MDINDSTDIGPNVTFKTNNQKFEEIQAEVADLRALVEKIKRKVEWLDDRISLM